MCCGSSHTGRLSEVPRNRRHTGVVDRKESRRGGGDTHCLRRRCSGVRDRYRISRNSGAAHRGMGLLQHDSEFSRTEESTSSVRNIAHEHRADADALVRRACVRGIRRIPWQGNASRLLRCTSVGHGEIDTPTACTSQSIGRDLVHGQFHDGCGADRMDRLRLSP